MSKKLANKDELNNVAGGNVMEDQIECPNCKQRNPKDYCKVKSEKDGCSIITYYKCPNCKHEWHD